MLKLTRFAYDGLEVVIDPAKEKTMTTVTGLATLCHTSIDSLVNWIHTNNIPVTAGEVPTPQGYQVKILLDERQTERALVDFNRPTTAIAKVGMKKFLAHVAGYEYLPISPKGNAHLYLVELEDYILNH